MNPHRPARPDRGGEIPSEGDWEIDPAVLGLGRALEPEGAFLHLATRLDAASEPGEEEIALDVELLNLDATSYGDLSRRCDGDAGRISALIASVVADRGKMQNPTTGSGGVLAGRVSWTGSRAPIGRCELGDLVVPLVSLVALPLRLDSVCASDGSNPQVPVTGRAIVTAAMPIALVPNDLGVGLALRIFDIYPVASHIAARATLGDHVLVLGGGHAGLLAAVAADRAVGANGAVTVVDSSPVATNRARAVAPGAVAIRADATDALGVARALRDAGRHRADLTVVCTSVPGCEGTALLATATRGTVLFFSTATSFVAAGLGADLVSSEAELVIPNGCTADRGSYAVDLVRENPVLREYLSLGVVSDGNL